MGVLHASANITKVNRKSTLKQPQIPKMMALDLLGFNMVAIKVIDVTLSNVPVNGEVAGQGRRHVVKVSYVKN